MLAGRAESEAKYTSDGRPYAETDYALTELSDRLDMLEAKLTNPPTPGALYQPEGIKQFILNGEPVAYQTGTAEHARFVKALRFGVTSQDYDRITLADISERTRDSLKTMALADDATGGYLCSPEFASDILRRSVDYSPVRRLVRVVPIGRAALGSDVPIRGEVNAAVRVAETGSRTPSVSHDLSFGMQSVPVHEMMVSTKLSRHLLADSQYPLDAELADAAAQSFALLEGSEFVNGNGVGCMLGLDNLSLPAGQVHTATGASATIAPTDLFDLIAHLPEQYLPGAQFLLNGASLLAIRKLRADATDGPFLFAPAASAYGSQLAGFPFTLCPELASPGTTGNKAVYFGDFRQAYALAVRQDITVIRLNELWAETGQVGFLIIQRTGGQPMIADAVARMVMGAQLEGSDPHGRNGPPLPAGAVAVLAALRDLPA